MRVVFLNKSKNPKFQLIKLVLVVLFLLPVLVLAYFAVLQVIRVDPGYEPRSDRDSQKGKHEIARTANELYIALDTALLEIDEAAREFFGPDHRWPGTSNELPPVIMNWADSDGTVIKTYAQLNSLRQKLQQQLETLASEIDQAAARGSEGTMLESELKAQRATENKIKRATADAEALARMLSSFGDKYTAFKETER